MDTLTMTLEQMLFRTADGSGLDLSSVDLEFQENYNDDHPIPDLFASRISSSAACQLRAFCAKPFNKALEAPGFTRVVVELRSPGGESVLAVCKAFGVFWQDVKRVAIANAQEDGREPEKISLHDAATETHWELGNFCDDVLLSDATFARRLQRRNRAADPDLRGPFGYMTRVIVSAHNRRRGIGRMLVRTMLQVLKEMGVRCVFSMPGSLLKWELESFNMRDLDAAEREEARMRRHAWATQKSVKFHKHLGFRLLKKAYFYHIIRDSDRVEGQDNDASVMNDA